MAKLTPDATRVALLAEGVDRNYTMLMIVLRIKVSPSSRRAWIEMFKVRTKDVPEGVALLAEGVDRNHSDARRVRRAAVALLAEGVDRNMDRRVR